MKKSPLKHHWLVSGYVVLQLSDGSDRQRGMNVMVLTDTSYFTRNDMAKAQQSIQMRFIGETIPVKGSKIIDVFIAGISHLGLMTSEQFNAGFSVPAEEAPKKGMN